MSSKLGPVYVPDESETEMAFDKPFSKALGDIIDKEARQLVTEAYERTERVLRENKEKLTKVIHFYA